MQIKDKIQMPLRIVFMGTPDFAVASLQALVEAGYAVVAVVTAPDKPAGRGMQLQQSAVKKYALAQQIPVLQPEKLKNPAFLEVLASYTADVQVVVAFRMLPEVVWNMPPMGTINVHGSLLPQYRGAAPINWAIMNGETQTGVTTFRLKHAIDTGDMLLQSALPIGPEETAGELHDRMMHAGAALLLRTLDGLVHGTVVPQPQPEAGDLKHAPKIFTDTCRVQPNRSATVCHNLIRGLSPFPGAFISFFGKTLKLYRSSLPHAVYPAAPVGTWLTNQKDLLLLQCATGPVALHEVQLEGKKRMSVADFLRGYKWAVHQQEVLFL